MLFKTKNNQLSARLCATKTHVVVAVAYVTYNDEGWARVFLEPEQAHELARQLVEYADRVTERRRARESSDPTTGMAEGDLEQRPEGEEV